MQFSHIDSSESIDLPTDGIRRVRTTGIILRWLKMQRLFYGSHNSRMGWLTRRELTTKGTGVLCALVPAFRHIAALLMLAVWLASSQHCGLEAAGIIAQDASHGSPHTATSSCCSDTGNPCSHDGCNVVESGTINPAVSFLKAPAPSLVVCACFICLQLVAPDVSAEPTLVAADLDRPKDWVPAWQFVRRAAPLSRAPSLIG